MKKFLILLVFTVFINAVNAQTYSYIKVNDISLDEAADSLIVNGFDISFHNDYSLMTTSKLIQFNNIQGLDIHYIATEMPDGVRFSMVMEFSEPLGDVRLTSESRQNKHIPGLWLRFVSFCNSFNQEIDYMK